MANKPLHSSGNKPIHSTGNRPVFGDVVFWSSIRVQLYINGYGNGGVVVYVPADMSGEMDSPSASNYAAWTLGSSVGTTGYTNSRVTAPSIALDWGTANNHGGQGWDAVTKKWTFLLYAWRFGYLDGGGGRYYNTDAQTYIVASVMSAGATQTLTTASLTTVLQTIDLDAAGENNAAYSGSPVATITFDPLSLQLTVS
jgi:hypothetical protein